VKLVEEPYGEDKRLLYLFNGAYNRYLLKLYVSLSFVGSVLMIYKIVVVKGMNGRVNTSQNIEFSSKSSKVVVIISCR